MPDHSAAPRTRLDSWKAIAAYLGRDVSTVVRWAKARGLPVHHVGGDRRRSAFAFTDEIDQWLATTPATTTDSSRPSNDRPTPRRLRLTLAVAVIAVLIIIGTLIWPVVARVRPLLLTAAIEQSSVVARGEGGRVAWSYPLPVPADYNVNAIAPSAVVIGTSVLAATVFQGSDYRTVDSGVLLSFDQSGRPVWRFAFDDKLVIGGRPFAGPWMLTSWAVEPGGAHRIIVAAHHDVWWPSLVALLDARGHRLATFTNMGWVARVQWAGPNRVLIMGSSNPKDGAMVALLDVGAFAGASPPDPNPTYACGTCAAGRPLRYVVLPRSELNLAVGSRLNEAVTISVLNDRLAVAVQEVPKEDIDWPTAPGAIYEFSPLLDFERASYSDVYWQLHRRLELQGTIRHARDACLENAGPRSIQMWEPATGWRTISNGGS